MSRINQLFNVSGQVNTQPNTKNEEGYDAFKLDLEQEYVKVLMTNTFGNTYYVSQKDLVQQAENIHTEMILKNPDFVAKALVYARKEGHMRSQPIFGLAKLFSMKGTAEEVAKRREIASSIFGKVIQTPNDLADFITLAKKDGCSLNGRKIKKTINNWIETNFSEYWAIKYGSGNKEVSLRSILRHFHPQHKELFRYLRAKKNGYNVDFTGLPQIMAFEDLKKATTDEQKIEAITRGKLPHEVATSFAGSSQSIWNSIVPNLPIMALLKNLATLERHDVANSNKNYILKRLSNKESIERSQILPYRFLEAEKHVNSAWIKDALRDALELSFVNIPNISGTTAVCLDISGSMQGDYLQKSAIFAIALMKKAELNGHFILFDTSAEEKSVSMRDSILTQASTICARGGTNTSCPIELLIQKKYKVDNIIMITDEQQNSGNLFYRSILNYRSLINRNSKVFVVDISPYSGGSLPSDMKNAYYIHGWSDQVLKFISMASNGWTSMVEYVRGLE